MRHFPLLLQKKDLSIPKSTALRQEKVRPTLKKTSLYTQNKIS